MNQLKQGILAEEKLYSERRDNNCIHIRHSFLQPDTLERKIYNLSKGTWRKRGGGGENGNQNSFKNKYQLETS